MSSLSSTTKTLKVRTSFKGLHNWPEASQFAGKEVGFLESKHRHTFYIQAELKVTNSDREVEFFVFQNQVNQAIKTLYCNSSQADNSLVVDLGRRSCETIAEEIIDYLNKSFGYSALTLEVWEDNEVGARIEKNFLAHS